MGSETFELYLLLALKDQGRFVGDVTRSNARLAETAKHAKSTSQASNALGASLTATGKQSVATAAGLAAMATESKNAGRAATDAGRSTTAATRSVASGELSLEEQRRAAQSLQRQRSAALLSQLKQEEATRRRVTAEEQRAAQNAKASLSDMESLRSAVRKDLVVGGVGVGTLYLMSKGIKVAGDFEQSMTDLKVAIAEVGKDGTPNMAKLNDQMSRFQALGIGLGNSLPGSTEDFVQMFTTLKQGGMQTERILGGAGKAVANLAVVTHQNPAELAKDYAQFGEMFQLSTQEEWTKSADLFARIYRATGVQSGEMVQGLKFAQIRAGANLGLRGLEGADQLGRILGTLRTSGLEGGFGGRELSRFLMQLAEYQKMAAKLKKSEGIDLHAKGIDLKFFDQGKFMGFDNVFKQLEKLRVLTEEERIKVGSKIFTAEGTAIATAFMNAGEEGWKKINDRVDAVLPLEQQITQITATWNAKLENVEGTLKNLAATGFTPLLNQLKPVLDLSNEWVGDLQELAAAHPGAAAVLGDLAGIGGVAVTLTAAVKAGTTAWGLYTLSSTAAARALQGEAMAATEASEATAAVNSRVLGLKNISAMKMTVTIAAVFVGFEMLQWLYDENKKYQAELKRRQEQVAATHEDSMMSRAAYAPRGAYWQMKQSLTQAERLSVTGSTVAARKEGADRAAELRGPVVAEEAKRATRDKEAQDMFSALSMQPAFKKLVFEPGSKGEVVGWQHEMAALIREQGLFTDPRTLSSVLLQVQRGDIARTREGGGRFLPEEIERLKGAISEARPNELKLATDEMTNEIMNLAKESSGVVTNLQNMNEWFGSKLPGSFDRMSSAASQFIFALDSVRPPSFNFGSDGPIIKKPGQKSSFLSHFDQGAEYIERGGLAIIHAGEKIVPARASARYREEARQQVVQHHHHGSRTVHLHVYGVNDPETLARMVAHELEIQQERA